MPKRISKAKLKKKRHSQEPDVNQIAYALVQRSVGDQVAEPESMTKAEISRLMAEMGRRGGKIGGKRRLQTMTPEKRSQVALKAARVRWAKEPRQ
jgi:hypothetical protein